MDLKKLIHYFFNDESSWLDKENISSTIQILSFRGDFVMLGEVNEGTQESND